MSAVTRRRRPPRRRPGAATWEMPAVALPSQTTCGAAASARCGACARLLASAGVVARLGRRRLVVGILRPPLNQPTFRQTQSRTVRPAESAEAVHMYRKPRLRWVPPKLQLQARHPAPNIAIPCGMYSCCSSHLDPDLDPGIDRKSGPEQNPQRDPDTTPDRNPSPLPDPGAGHRCGTLSSASKP